MALTHAFGWPEVRRGAERLVGELARTLADLGTDVTVFSSAFDHGVAEEDGVHQVRFRRRHEDPGRAERAFGQRLLPALVRERFDVVHSFGRFDGAASVRAARLHRRRATVHTDIGLPLRSQWRRRRDARAVERVVTGVDVYGCMSHASMAGLREEYGRDGTLLPGGVDLRAFAPGPRTPHPSILFPGAIDVRRKGLAALIEAMPKVAASVPGARLVLTGPGNRATIVDEASPEALDHVDDLGAGQLGDLPSRYASAWACALPSTHDTFGLVLIEALASGTPVVAGNSHALPEVVEEGTTGVLCEPFDVDSVADACIRSLRLAETPGIADRCRRSVERFDWRGSVVPTHLAVYETAVRDRQRRAN